MTVGKGAKGYFPVGVPSREPCSAAECDTAASQVVTLRLYGTAGDLFTITGSQLCGAHSQMYIQVSPEQESDLAKLYYDTWDGYMESFESKLLTHDVAKQLVSFFPPLLTRTYSGNSD